MQYITAGENNSISNIETTIQFYQPIARVTLLSGLIELSWLYSKIDISTQ